MYFTSGAKVITSRLRTRTSPVVLYSCQRACASSGEMRFFVCWREDMGTVSAGIRSPSIPHPWYSSERRRLRWSAHGPVELERPHQDLGHGFPQLLRHLVAE